MKTFTAAVVGLGNIGQGFDYDQTGDRVVLTHATGFATHAGFQLVAGVDPQPERRARFEAKFRAPSFATVAELHAALSPEVVSIGVPTDAHAAVFAEVAARRPQAILLEKPIAARLEHAQQIVTAARAAGCAVLVNYMRRFEPGVRALKGRIEAGELGTIYKATVWYAKGLLNNGSHLIDLLSYLLGDPTETQVLAPGRPHGAHDHEPDVRVRFGAADGYLLAAREECFSIAELTLLGTRGLVHYRDAGAVIELQAARPDPVFPGYTTLAPQGERLPSDLDRIQHHVAEALYRRLVDDVPLASDQHTASRTLAVVQEAFRQVGRSDSPGEIG